LKSAQDLAESISVKLLQSGMMSRFNEDTIRKKIRPFLVQEQTKSHGRMIAMAEAKQYGLRMNEVQLQSQLWSWLWELYIRANWTVSARSRKILESARSGIGT
jgi:hypothetical protein